MSDTPVFNSKTLNLFG